jgi:HSP20 family protein
MFSDPFFNTFGSDGMVSALSGIRADVKDANNEFVIEAELPGIPRDRIELDVHNGVLTISANEELDQKEERSDYVYRERRIGHISRSFALDNVKENEIKAEYKDGVLFVHLPKAEPTAKGSRKIDIQ